MEVMSVETLTTIATGAVLALFGTILAWQGKGRFDALERRSERVEAEIAQLRSDLLQVVLAVVPGPRRA